MFVTAAIVDAERRTISGLILPWGQAGSTSAGRLTFRRGSVQLPDDVSRVKLFMDHAALGIGSPGRTVVGYAAVIADTLDGLLATFKIKDGPEGDMALAEAGTDKVRDGLSVEVVELALDGDDVTAGQLVGVALVPIPAYTDARVTSVAAAMAEDETPTESELTMTIELVAEASPPAPFTINYTPDTPEGEAAESGQAEAATTQAAATATPLPVAAAPASLQASTRPQAGIPSLQGFYAALTQRHSGRATRELEAALDDITRTGTIDAEQPAWVGQLWSGVAYQRKVVPLLGVKPLTSYTVNGWKWTTKPEVDTWAGDKELVPSNPVSTEPATNEAERLAGAHDIDRKYRDFNDTAFFQAYYEAMTESYARKSDAALVAALLTAATDEATPSYPLFMGAIASGVAMIDDETGAGSTFVLCNKADLIPFVLATTTFDMPAMLKAIGVDLDRIVTHAGVTAGHVVVGTSAAMDYYELPGSPIRVEAVDMVKGGIDAGVFGYYATMLHDAAGIVDVTIDTTP